MNFQIATQPDDINFLDCIIIPLNQKDDEVNEALSKHYQIAGLQRHLKQINSLAGAFSSVIVDKSSGGDQVLILWNPGTSSQAEINQQAIEFATKNKRNIDGQIGIDYRFFPKTEFNVLASLVRALILSNYSLGTYKTENNGAAKEIAGLYVFSVEPAELIQDVLDKASASADTIRSCMELVNAPANYKSPQFMADWLSNSAKKNSYKIEILEKEDLERLGFHALLAVNRGSEDPAKCLVATYNGAANENDSPIVALVGKGVTFDTGGLSIKPSQNMHYMKSDMGGAAAVMGTIDLVSKLKLNVNLVAVIPCTDNSVDSKAVKPGDVIGSFKGSTIEVIDTDAEGRLILADGLNYAIQTFKPDYVIDLATLTGSIVRSLGSHAAGLMTKK